MIRSKVMLLMLCCRYMYIFLNIIHIFVYLSHFISLMRKLSHTFRSMQANSTCMWQIFIHKMSCSC